MTEAQMKKDIRSIVDSHGLVNWKECEWLQPEGAKKQSQESFEKLKKSIIKNGLASPLFVWKSKAGNVILDGHHRHKAFVSLESEGYNVPQKMPAVFVKCSGRADAIKLCAIFSSQYAKASKNAFLDFLAGIDADDFEIPGVELRADPIAIGDDEVKERAPSVCKPGDLWKLGDHLLYCGDSTKEESYTRIMGKNEKARLLCTDPPYGVDMAGVATRKRKRYGVKNGLQNVKIAGDDFSEQELVSLLDGFLEKALALCENAAVYIWAPQGGPVRVFLDSFARAGLLFHRQIIWVKGHHSPSMQGMYHYKHEQCLFGWRKGSKPAWYGKKNQMSVWEVERDSVGRQRHPSQKPVELFAIPIRNHTREGDIVLEPFAGSGSHIIAAEELKRSCRAIELDPKNCDVIIDRWQIFTGKKAKKL